MDLYERLTSRLCVCVTGPADDLFYRQPADLEAFCPGEVLDAQPVEVRLFRRRIEADAWQVKFRSTESSGAAVSGVTTVGAPALNRDEALEVLRQLVEALQELRRRDAAE